MLPFTKQLSGLLIIGTTLFFACKSAEPGPTDNLSLAMNQSARLNSDILVRVDSIQDSRCPIGYNCFIAGWATTSLTISAGTDAQKRKLILGSFSKDRKDSTTVDFQSGRYKVILRDVVPYPIADKRPVQQAVIQVSRL